VVLPRRADITGFVMAGVMAALGFFIIPAKRRKARAEIRAKVSSLTGALRRALGAEFERAQARSAQRFADAMGPYTRFVRAERERWDTHRSSLTAFARSASVSCSRRSGRCDLSLRIVPAHGLLPEFSGLRVLRLRSAEPLEPV
jgi:hypothetical protein